MQKQKYNSENKLKVFTAFSGYDSQCLGLERLKEYALGFDYELIGWSEINKWACVGHNALFPQYSDRNYGDVSKIDWKSVPDFDLFTYSSPCFVAGTKVIVETGYERYAKKNIEDIKVGDLVLTHTGEYKKVTDVMCHKYHGALYTITNNYGDEVQCTPDHRFYCTDNSGESYEWISAKDLSIIAHEILCAEYDKWYGFYSLIDISITSIHIEKTWKDIDVYNLEVEDNHSYTANNFVVHNCQDWSPQGWQRGGAEGSGTRSSLLWECKKAIETKRPKFCILENVTGLLQSKFYPYFQKWMNLVDSFGYRSYHTVLNAKDFGLPHNRPRVFLVSVRNDVNLDFSFPKPIGDDKRGELYEILEPDEVVDEKWYRSEERLNHYLELNKDYMEKIDNPENSVPGKYDVKPFGLYCHCTDQFNSVPIYNLARTLKVSSIESGIIYKQDGKWKERLFTYRELYRLMGFTDEEFETIQNAVTSTTNLAKLAGNSIVVNVMFHIFRKLFVDTELESGDSVQLF